MLADRIIAVTTTVLTLMTPFPWTHAYRSNAAPVFRAFILLWATRKTRLKLACRQIGISTNLAGSQFGRAGFLLG